ncbi:MAG: hypothetical protein PHC54_00025 [Candidatus Omnitrophica bacterium]|nr:hypothetical protein [Candidatus Omnitrophota bacterium]MDD5592038.1 hypothetical protein [Candidatus Omnitrophota bacterium]
MKKYIVILAAAGLFILGLRTRSLADEFIWQNISREILDLRCVLIDSKNPRIIYIGSDKGIFKTEDAGESWRNIFLAKGQNKAVNFLLFDHQNRNYLYAATGNGLFYSHNQGQGWRRIFQGKNYLESDCTSIAVLSEAIYLGTRSGFFVSKDKGRSWQRASGTLANSNILAIAVHPKKSGYISLACVDGVFQTQDGGQSWERVFVAKPVENGDSDNGQEKGDRDEEQRFSQVSHISCDLNNLNYLYLATAKGLYKSQDKGKSWDAVSNYGLLSQGIKFLLVSDRSDIYALTKSGIFKYSMGRWQELSFSLPADDIRFLVLDNLNNLYAACDKGLFKANLTGFSNNGGGNTFFLYCQGEPKINEVQQAAIKYAEVEPQKIMRWRKQAAKRAFLPQVNIGLDRNITDLWHWETGSSTKTEDDILRKGNDGIGWDVTLSWDLGELIWNDDQTSIDVRSRLMVELRDEILDEVTKLYFERIRTKAEMDNLSIEDRKKRFEKELKLQELTASIDALTGGYFSRQIHESQGT